MIDKERLEDIRAEVEQMAYTSPLNFEKTRINKESALWLIEQVERVQDLKIMLKVLGEENQRYKHALEFYADKKTYELSVKISMGTAFPCHEPIKYDKGEIARKALEGEE